MKSFLIDGYPVEILDSEDLALLKIVHINKASVIFFHGGMDLTLFATPNVANKILNSRVKYAIIDKLVNSDGNVTEWLALPSRF